MVDLAAARKARGAFYTPPQLAAFLTRWAVRTAQDCVLEPSCGDGAILASAGMQLAALGACRSSLSHQLHGVDSDPNAVAAARNRMAAFNLDGDVKQASFLSLQPEDRFDVVVGNPPYIRYQLHKGSDRADGLQAALAQGVRLSGLASSWAPFLVHSAAFLRPSGRLALVLPAELLSVNYAGVIRSFILNRFSHIRLVMFEELVFPGVSAEVVILLAGGNGRSESFEVVQVKNLEALSDASTLAWATRAGDSTQKWTPALLDNSAFEVYERCSGSSQFSQLKDWGRTYLGSVTGANSFFAKSADDLRRHQIEEGESVKILPPGTRYLKGLTFTKSAWQMADREGAKTRLFRPNHEPSQRSSSYIEQGQRAGVQEAYKCAVREPWWRVPLMPTPDLILTYMNHERPHLVANEARVDILNSVYGVSLHKGMKTIGMELLPIASLNSLTLLGAEIVGRAYGGGLSKLEPREADLLPMPSRKLLEACRDRLSNLRPHLASHLRRGDLKSAVSAVDEIVLISGLHLEADEVCALRQSRDVLFQRRLMRGKLVRE